LALKKKNNNFLANRVLTQLRGLVLAHAFVIIRREGFKIRVSKIDGSIVVPITKGEQYVDNRISVDVKNGIVTNVWLG
jgi:hypothetical protein